MGWGSSTRRGGGRIVRALPRKFVFLGSGTRSTTTRNRNLQFRGAVSTGGSPLDFLLFSSINVQFSKTSPLKSGESSEKSSGENRVKSCHVCGCHGFFGPDWVSREGTWDVPGILLGCPGPLGVFGKFVQEKFVLIFRSLRFVCSQILESL